MNTRNDPVSLLTVKKVSARVGLSAPTIYRRIRAGEFPAPISIGVNSRWPSDRIDAWIAEQIANADRSSRAQEMHETTTVSLIKGSEIVRKTCMWIEGIPVGKFGARYSVLKEQSTGLYTRSGGKLFPTVEEAIRAFKK